MQKESLVGTVVWLSLALDTCDRPNKCGSRKLIELSNGGTTRYLNDACLANASMMMYCAVPFGTNTVICHYRMVMLRTNCTKIMSIVEKNKWAPITSAPCLWEQICCVIHRRWVRQTTKRISERRRYAMANLLKEPKRAHHGGDNPTTEFVVTVCIDCSAIVFRCNTAV